MISIIDLMMRCPVLRDAWGFWLLLWSEPLFFTFCLFSELEIVNIIHFNRIVGRFLTSRPPTQTLCRFLGFLLLILNLDLSLHVPLHPLQMFALE